MKTRRTIQILLALALTSFAAVSVAQQVDTPSNPATVGPSAPGNGDSAKTPTPDPTTAVPKPTNSEELRERVTFLLSGYEFFPTRDDLDKVGDPADVVAVLQDIVRDKDAKAMHRLRAVDALGFYELPQVAGFLKKLTKGAKAADLEASARHSALMQHHAITSLARSQRAESLGALEPFLEGDDLQLKLTAVVALGKHGKDKGRDRLRKLVKTDDNKLVQREARKYLR